MATAVLDDPAGYGRDHPRCERRLRRDRRTGDATPEQREIKEVFPSYYCVKTDALIDALGKLKNNNSKREYYLTDIYGIFAPTASGSPRYRRCCRRTRSR
jgi:bifunctional UDP-N-acetylglucosamine pyrophosphorylase/glucosamine-1-phosphate N-acetyltransferase